MWYRLLQLRRASSSSLGVKEVRICLNFTPTNLNAHIQQCDNLTYSVPHRSLSKYGNINPFPHRLRFSASPWADSPCPRLTLDQEPYGLPANGFHRFIVTYVSIRTSDTSSKPLDSPSSAYRTLPYPTVLLLMPQLRCYI